MKNILVIITTLTLFISACQSQQADNKYTVKETLTQLKHAVNSKKFEAITDYLSEDYQYEDMGKSMSKSVLKQVILQFPTIISLNIDNTTVESDKVQVDVTIRTTENTTQKTIILDKNNRIIRADIASLSMQGHNKSNSNNEVKNKTHIGSSHTVMPFSISESQMVVEATINGKKGNFVVDSGTPMALMLNSNFQNYNGSIAKKNPLDVSGEMGNSYDVNIDSFEWNGLLFNNVQAVSLDLNDLGRRLKVDSFAGTIGYAILKNYIVDYDYENNQLKLWTNKDAMTKYYNLKSEQTISFTMAHHLPVIKAKIGDKEFRFGLDCGAETNMIDPVWKENLKEKYDEIGIRKLSGAGIGQRDVLKVTMRDFNLNDKSYTMNFLFAKMQGGQHEVTMMDGLIGNQFLAYRKTVINYLENELYFVD